MVRRFLRPRRLCPSRSFLHVRPLLALHTHTSPAVPLRHHATTPLLLLSTSLKKKNLSLSPFFSIISQKAFTPLHSPVPEALYPALSVSLTTVGLAAAAGFFV